MHAMAKMAKNRQPLAIWIRCQKWPLGGWRFRENGHFGKNRQRAGDNGDKRPGPLKTGDFGENGNCGEIGDFRKNHQRAGDIQNVGLYSNWMPKVAPPSR